MQNTKYTVFKIRYIYCVVILEAFSQDLYVKILRYIVQVLESLTNTIQAKSLTKIYVQFLKS